MKNIFVLIITILFFVIGCKKYDTVPPIIKLNGDETMYIELNTPFYDPGAVVTDNEDKSPQLRVLGSVDVTRAGKYTLTYVARDKENNYANTIYRTVYVVITPNSVVGDYSVVETTGLKYDSKIDYPYAYYPEPTAKWNRVVIDNLGGLDIKAIADMTSILGDQIVLPNYVYMGYTINGTGTITPDAREIQFTYVKTDKYLNRDTIWTVWTRK